MNQQRSVLSQINWEETALRAFALRRKTAVLIFTLCLLALTVIILSLPKKYRSEMKLLVKNERQDLVVSPDSTASNVHVSELTETQVNSEIELIKSNDVLRKVVIQSGLAHQPGTVQAAGEPSAIAIANSVQALERNLQVEPIKKSDIIQISYSSKNPQVATAVLNQLADDYLEVHLKVHAAPGTYTFFDRQATSYAQELQKSEDQLRRFREYYSMLATPDAQQALIQRSVEAQGALEEADAQLADYQSRASQSQLQVKALPARVISQIRTVPQSALVQQLTTMQVQLENRRTELLTKFRPDDRLVKEVDRELESTRSQLRESSAHDSVEQQTDLNQVRQEAEKGLVTAHVMSAGLKARRGRLRNISNEYKARMLKLAAASVEEDQRIRKVKENEQNYLLYARKKEEARIAESLDQQRITNVAVVESATVPVKPFSPNTKLDLLIAVLLSALISFVSVVLLEWARPSAITFEHVRPFAAAAVAGD